ncbi:unnamed protein product [Phaedon cochleariae]|uniref:Uncharacterized protein n=1 Tax=Phaedon cochleariae TaxID=80249 RepID=A0A9P0D7E3_PHACE|nr:unnamed protein product [Phaedon cochleariae]
MYTVVNDIKRSYALFSAVFITLITTKAKAQDNCNADQLMHCAKPLSVLTDSGLTSFVSSKSDLEKVCPDLKEAIKCIHGFTRHCMSKEDRSHFRTLFHGTGLMVHELCRNGTYQDEYLKHAPCMSRAANENEVCFKRYTRAMHTIQSNSPEINISEPDIVTVLKKKRAAADEGIKNICCAFQEYVECSTQSVRRKCGDISAEFSHTFLDKMSAAMIQLHCTEYGRRECGMMSSSQATRQTVLTLLTIYLFQWFLR